MKVLLLGVGMQGKVALYDLVKSAAVDRIVAADIDSEGLRSHVESRAYEGVHCEELNAHDHEALDRLMAGGFDVAIDLLPTETIGAVARSAVRNGVHLVNTFHVSDELRGLAEEAERGQVAVLPEFGLDPGIDLVLLGECVRAFDEVDTIRTYGAGIPEKNAADNPIHYKVSWTLEGALRSYNAPACIVQDGEVRDVGGDELFHPNVMFVMEHEDLGDLEAFPNGDALQLLAPLGLRREDVQDLGRYTLRWPGHASFWRKIVDLHLLDPEPVIVDGREVDRAIYMAAALGPHLSYGPDERDIALVRVEVEGRKDGRRFRAVQQVLDRRDLETGFLAMARTVGFTASIGAQMIARGEIKARGLLSPLCDVPYQPFVNQLGDRGVEVTREMKPILS
jgi:saccharopine dehydrogenase-like NADP-dependent oxidoreductase